MDEIVKIYKPQYTYLLLSDSVKLKYEIIKNHLLVSKIRFKILDLNNINDKTLDYKENQVYIIYIDGIDLENSKYLIIKRNELFEKLMYNSILM